VESFKASGRISQGSRDIFVNADVVRPLDYAMQASIIESREERRVEAVAKGGELFIKPHGTQDWYRFSGPGVVGFDLPNAVEMLEESLAKAQGLAFKGREAVGGVETYHFKGEVEPVGMGGWSGGGAKATSKAVLEVWVGQVNGRVYKLSASGVDDEGPYTAVFSFSSFNQAEVAAPATAKSLEDLRDDFIKAAIASAGLPEGVASDELLDCVGLSLGLDFLLQVMTGEALDSADMASAVQTCAVDLGLAPKPPLVDPSSSLPQTPDELKALLGGLPVETQACLRQAVGDGTYIELRTGQRLPTLSELTLALPCLR
jgi:hypothetical protein